VAGERGWPVLRVTGSPPRTGQVNAPERRLMQFWSGTPFMETADALAIARMLDECGYDGVICADHLIYPRNLERRRTLTGQTSAHGRRKRRGRIRGS